MTSASQPRDEIGRGPLSRGSAVVYWFVVIEAMIVLFTLPALALMLLVEQDVSNLPLYLLLLIPVGPALSAALFAWRVFTTDRDLRPARHFLRGYRVNFGDALKVWAPALLVLTVLGVNVLNAEAAGMSPIFVGISGVLGVLVLLWTMNAIAVVSMFSFRWRDVVRVSAYYLFIKPLVNLGIVSLLVLAGGIVYFWSDWVLVLLGSVFAYWLFQNARPMLVDLQAQFIAEPESD